MPRNQREWIKALEDGGWIRERGGKHQVKMVKPGKRPISCRSTRAGLTARASMRRYGDRRVYDRPRGRTMRQLALHVDVHHEDGSYWAEVRELPGCFASGGLWRVRAKSAI